MVRHPIDTGAALHAAAVDTTSRTIEGDRGAASDMFTFGAELLSGSGVGKKIAQNMGRNLANRSAATVVEGADGKPAMQFNDPDVVRDLDHGFDQLVRDNPSQPNSRKVSDVAKDSQGWPERGGSGPAPGTIGITDSSSTAALRNYYPKEGGIEFVYDPTTNRLAAGSPKKGLFDGSPHEQLAQSIGTARNSSEVLGGTFQRGPKGEFLTTENSGHYGQNWTNQNREQFQQWLSNRVDLPVYHGPWRQE
jgi:filamentous hemagglutinin